MAAPDGTWPPTIKRSVIAAKGMVTSNHPLASLAGTEMLVAGGNAVDAAIATMFALSVVEPMMVTIFGAGFVHIRLSDGTSTVIDNYVTVPEAASPDMFVPIAGKLDHKVEGERNETGHLAVAVGGTLLGWTTAIERYGRLTLGEILAPAIRYARDGFRVSPYLRAITLMQQANLRRYPATADVFLPGGTAPAVGDRLRRTDYAATLDQIAGDGADYLYHGPLGEAIAADMAVNGGCITMRDIASYQVVERSPIRGDYRGFEILGPPPPSSGPLHIIQMLNILSGFNVAELGFGTADSVHLWAEVMKIAFADRFRYVADPASLAVPVDWLTSEEYAASRRAEISMERAQQYAAGEQSASKGESTTHCCAIDEWGNVVATTNTLHLAFGSCVTVPGTGVLLNDCMELMDPVPGRANSIAPGKRVLSSMSPTIVLKDGAPFLTLGTPGGLKIFGVVAQAIVNVIDHQMPLQTAFEAPRMWDRGPFLELERGFPRLAALGASLEARGHNVATLFKVAGGMNGIMGRPDGLLEGAACWRADGAPVGYSGGDALVEQDATRAMWK
jgi:gamma-glutamyltranspeptidase / glutathione hydrolase